MAHGLLSRLLGGVDCRRSLVLALVQVFAGFATGAPGLVIDLVVNVVDLLLGSSTRRVESILQFVHGVSFWGIELEKADSKRQR